MHLELQLMKSCWNSPFGEWDHRSRLSRYLLRLWRARASLSKEVLSLAFSSSMKPLYPQTLRSSFLVNSGSENYVLGRGRRQREDTRRNHSTRDTSASGVTTVQRSIVCTNSVIIFDVTVDSD